VPASLALQRQYGSDLQVLFVEVQGADADTAEAFAWRQEWMGTAAMWSTERPLELEGTTIPKFALLDNDGNVLLSGNPLEQKKQIEEAVAAEVKKAKAPPAGTPAGLAKAWATFLKGDVTGALAACDALSHDASLGEAASTLRKELAARTDARLLRARWLIDNGYPSEAEAELAALTKAVKGCADFEESVAGQRARLALADAAPELEAAKALSSLQQRMLKNKPFEDANVKALAKLAEKHAGTKAAERAARLARLAKLEVAR
jgi:hypothetical protein